MHEVRIQVEVPAAARAVWDVFSDYRGWPEWSRVKEVVLRSPGDPDPYGVGAVCVLRAKGIAIEEEITGFEPPRRLAYRIVAGLPLRAHEAEVVLTPRGEHTHLDWQVRFEPWVPGTAGPIAALFRRELLAIAARLKAYPFKDPQAS